MTFAALNVGPSINAYWWVEIEGIRKRYGTYLPSWNPADSGTNQHIEALLVEPPRIGSQRVDPLNGRSEISQHSFAVMDADNEITSLISSPSIGDKAFLTADIDSGTCNEIVVDDSSDLPSSGHLYIDRETFYYTTKDASKSQTGLLSESIGLQTVTTTTDKITLKCSALTQDNGYWEGAICHFVGGANDGLSREVFRSTGAYPLSGKQSDWTDAITDDELTHALYFDPNSELTATVTVGDTFYLTEAPRRIRCSSLSGATSDYWVGAVVTITADPVTTINVGESRIVTSFNPTSKVLTLNESLPAPVSFASPGDGAATFSIVKTSLSGISRGLYKSKQEEHKIADKRGDYTPVEITTRPTFIRNRRAWIYENRVGALEADAKKRGGVLSDIKLRSDLVSYEFSIDSMYRLLSQKILQKPWTGSVVGFPIWGGCVSPHASNGVEWGYLASDAIAGIGKLTGIIPSTSDGDTTQLEFWKIPTTSVDAPRERGNIRIGNELIHYKNRVFIKNSLRGGGRYDLELGQVDDSKELMHIWDQGTREAVTQQGYVSFELENWCVQSRGLLSRQCGKSSLSKWISKAPEEINNQLATSYKVSIPSFMEEHKHGDEVRDVIYCDGSFMSDFIRIDLLVILAGSASGTLSVGDTVTGSKSGAVGVVNNIYDDGTAFRFWVRREDNESEFFADFIEGELVTTVGGWDGELESHTPGDGVRGPARNNPFNVILAMLLSGGDDKPYGYLPEGFGLGMLEDDVDIEGIEELRDRFFSSTKVDFAITEPTEFSEWSEQLFRSLSIFPFETNEGKISIGYMMTESECVYMDDGSLLSVGDDVITASMAPDWTYGRKPITKIEVKYNKNPCSSDWYGKLEINFSRSRGTSVDFGRSEEIECSSLYVPDNQIESVDPRSPELPDLIARLINPLWGRHAMFPAPIVIVSVPYSYDARIDIGDIVKVTHDLLPNLRTGARGFSGEYFQVVSKEPNVQSGTCGLELWQIGVHDNKYGRSCPSAVVVSYQANTPSSGKSTVTVKRQAYGKQGNDRDIDYFVTGDEVCFLTASCDTISSPVEVATIESIGTSALTITLDQNISTPPVAGYIVTLPQYDSATSTRRSKNVFLSGEDNTLGSSDDAAFRYH